MTDRGEETVRESGPANTFHLVLFQFGARGYLGRTTVKQVQDLLEDIVDTDPASTRIDVWLASPGGDAHAAYKLMLALRASAAEVNFVIPDFAKSAATLMALGADCIFMAPAAELGPLDVQMEHHNREGTRVSGLDVTGALEYLLSKALDMTLIGGGKVRKYTQLPRGEVLSATLSFMAQVLRPAVAKLDPDLIHQAAQQLMVAAEYGKKLLLTRGGAERPALSGPEIEEILERLVSRYPAHEFVISRDEARDVLHLPVRNIEEYPRWDQVRAMYRDSLDKAMTNSDGDICAMLRDADLDVLTPQVDLQTEAPPTQSPEADDDPAIEGAEANRKEAVSGDTLQGSAHKRRRSRSA